ncbi:hypothetical protein [Catenuloplanes indicus]|uniref:Uncharacterized protein n=1 Tax=Catenuloplanes indicus TaxID=137267 RepID=A0AAE3VU78_9ACTN|nr:hypothetical protein [Catenuloplanes indicus]MDQ0363419.1 hypothetical protein [Catenuloplanes indicus]
MTEFVPRGVPATLAAEAVAEMVSPVRCLICSAIYDVGKVTVTARYTDCSVWVSPCCNQQVDDRQHPWTATPRIETIDKASFSPYALDVFGRMEWS